MPNPQIQTMIVELLQNWHHNNLHKLTLSRPGAHAPTELQNIYIKPGHVKGEKVLSCTFHYAHRDEVKNFNNVHAEKHLIQWLEDYFKEAVLFTAGNEMTLRTNRKGESILHNRIVANQPAASPQATITVGREKKRLIEPTLPWLHALGLSTSSGEIKAQAQDKWRQMNKYIEVIGALLDTTPLHPNAHIVDMGSGKGYLTFALYAYLQQRYDFPVQITGVELREPLVKLCNQIAFDNGYSGLRFIAKDIAEVQEQKIDMLIALHACDTATDLALLAGIKSKAKIVVVAPCCHKQVRKDLEGTSAVQSILANGIMMERQAEILTDTMRSLLMQAEGYKTKVFEFISTEHTPKNVMITAEKRSQKPEIREKALAELHTLKQTFGVKRHFLEEKLRTEKE